MSHTIAEDFIGPCFIIICFVLILYGVFCAQVYFYCTTYRDHSIIRSLVVILIVLETAHVAFCIHAVYDYLILDHAHSGAFKKIIWSVGASILTEYLISGLVQGWYIYRIWSLYSNKIVTAFLIALWTARMGVAFRYDSYLFQYSNWDDIEDDKYYWIVLNTAFAMNVVVDLAITLVLTIHLYSKRSWTIKRSTRNIVATLISLAIGAGVLNLIASTALFFAANLTKYSITYGGIMELEAKLYANSILVMLNARRSIVDKAAADANYTLDLSRIKTHPFPVYACSTQSQTPEAQKEMSIVADPWARCGETPIQKHFVDSLSPAAEQTV